jgi:hypothetical protein
MKYIALIILSVMMSSLSAQDIADPQKRMASLDIVRTLLTTQVLDQTPEELNRKNPFNPIQVVRRDEAAAPVIKNSERDILTMAAGQINPSGSAQLGDTSILLFGQKKLKVGDTIPIVFQGVTYELVISVVDRTYFSLRLNDEEITRPIKPAASKP